MKHLGCYPLTSHDGDHREQYGNHDEDKKCSLECRVSPSLVTSVNGSRKLTPWRQLKIDPLVWSLVLIACC
jgi:hypothetical protein